MNNFVNMRVKDDISKLSRNFDIFSKNIITSNYKEKNNFKRE